MSSDKNLISQQIDVHVIKQNGQKRTNEIVPLMVRGRVGHNVIITPHDYLPKGYYIDSADHDRSLHFNADSSVTPSHIKFIYDRQKSHAKPLGLIKVHYQDSKNPGHDINLIKVHKRSGQPFALKKYTHNLPIGTFFIGISRGAEEFKRRTQDVVILVRHYVKAWLVFKDTQGRVINKRPLLAHYLGSAVPYSKLKRYVPAGYQFVKWGQRRHILHSKDVDIMIVKKKTSDDNSVSKKGAELALKGLGRILINYSDHGKLVDRYFAIGKLNRPFSVDYYCKHLPRGYHFVKLETGANVRRFARKLQLVWVEITR